MMATATSRAEEITEVLRTEILRGQYRPSERLPSERDLAARFKSNRGAIREVIKKLEQLGIVSVTPGGVRILPVEDATLEVLGYLLELGEIQQPELVGQVMDVLGAMFALSARSAMEAANEEELASLHSIVGNLITSLPDQEKHHAAWQELSEKMLAIHHNLVLRLVGNGLRTRFLGILMNQSIPMDIDMALIQSSLESLREAVARRQPGEVSDTLVQHFQIIKSALLASARAGENQKRSNTGHA